MQEIKLKTIPTLEQLLSEGNTEIKSRRIIENIKIQNEILEEIIEKRNQR
jgi:hypothetical protein